MNPNALSSITAVEYQAHQETLTNPIKEAMPLLSPPSRDSRLAFPLPHRQRPRVISPIKRARKPSSASPSPHMRCFPARNPPPRASLCPCAMLAQDSLFCTKTLVSYKAEPLPFFPLLAQASVASARGCTPPSSQASNTQPSLLRSFFSQRATVTRTLSPTITNRRQTLSPSANYCRFTPNAANLATLDSHNNSPHPSHQIPSNPLPLSSSLLPLNLQQVTADPATTGTAAQHGCRPQSCNTASFAAC